MSGTKIEGECTVDDTRKLPVFMAIFNHWDPSLSRAVSPHDIYSLQLKSVTARTVFARCVARVVDMVSQQIDLQIFRDTGEPFGVIQSSGSEGKFSVFPHLAGKWEIHFEDLSRSPANVYNEDGTLLSIVESIEIDGEGKQRLIRIAPLCDAGLMITTVLGVLLLGQKATNYLPRSSRKGSGSHHTSFVAR
jgi:hypothetical protein